MPKKVDRCVEGLKKSLVEEYEKEHGSPPSKNRRKEIERQAWRICMGRFGKEADK